MDVVCADMAAERSEICPDTIDIPSPWTDEAWPVVTDLTDPGARLMADKLTIPKGADDVDPTVSAYLIEERTDPILLCNFCFLSALLRAAWVSFWSIRIFLIFRFWRHGLKRPSVPIVLSGY